MAELFCQMHGPYDASYGTCPTCSGVAKSPPPPMGLEDDNVPTQLKDGGGGYPAGGGFNNNESDTEAPTAIPPRFGGRRESFDVDEEADTEIPGGKRGADRMDETVLEHQPSGTVGILWVLEGARRGKVYQLKDGAVIGRTEGDLVLDDEKVSNPHAKLTLEDDLFVVWDFGSKNGTYVNGTRIRGATPLEENDHLKVGSTVFVMKMLEPPARRVNRSAGAKKPASGKKK